MTTYKTEEHALKRVAFLAKHYSIWPAVVRNDDDTYTLAYDPAPWQLTA